MSVRALRSIAGLAITGAFVFTGGAPAQAQSQLAPACNPATISGTALDGETLTASRGSCSAPQPAVTLQWFSCDLAQPPACVARTGQAQDASLTYTAKPADVNGRLVAQQVATNLFGDDLDNTTTDVVAAIRPSATPVISGIARVGEQLSGSEGFLSGTNASVVARHWFRCEAGGSGCVPITGATGRLHLLTGDDEGKTIRFQVTVQGPQETRNVQSPPTAAVQPAPAVGGGDPGSGQDETGSPAPEAPAAPKLLKPFPSVVISGRVFRVGAVISTLLVRGPSGARVTVTCRGRGCPRRRQERAIRGGSLHLRPFETGLLAGTVIEIRVTRRGRIGKFTRLRIRSDRPPTRIDSCLSPGRWQPVSCPEGVG